VTTRLSYKSEVQFLRFYSCYDTHSDITIFSPRTVSARILHRSISKFEYKFVMGNLQSCAVLGSRVPYCHRTDVLKFATLTLRYTVFK